MRRLLFLLLVAAPALARDPLTGMEDLHDIALSRTWAKSGRSCPVPTRNRSEVRKFRRRFACPATGKTTGACPGWIVDHIRALKHCGPDKSANMAWQTVDGAKAKDRWE